MSPQLGSQKAHILAVLEFAVRYNTIEFSFVQICRMELDYEPIFLDFLYLSCTQIFHIFHICYLHPRMESFI